MVYIGRRSKLISLKTLQLCKRFVQMSFDFVTGATRSQTWRQRMIESFGKDPLICSKCKEEMLLWKIWHPKYGAIFDLSRDGPFIEEEHYQNKNRPKSQPKAHIQLCLFSA